MSVLSSDTYLNKTTILSVLGSGGGGGGGVTQLLAGSNVSLSPAGGTGVVTVNAIGGGGSNTPNQSFSTISMGGTGTIAGVTNLTVSSINGAAPGGGGSNTPNQSFSTISMGGTGTIAGVTNLSVSSINGAAPGGGSGPFGDITVSSLTTTGVNAINMTAVGTSTILRMNRAPTRYTDLYTADPVSMFRSSDNAGVYTVELGNTDPSVTLRLSNAPSSPVSTTSLTLSYTGAYTSSMTCSSINSGSANITDFNCSTINGAPPGAVNAFEYNSFPQDKYISSFADWTNVGGFASGGVMMSTIGAQITPFISTVSAGNRTLVCGNIVVTPSTVMPPGTPNAYMGIYGGGGTGPGLFTNNMWSYPMLSTVSGRNQGRMDLSWVAGGGREGLTGIQNPAGPNADSTINYFLYVSPDWPVTMLQATSTFLGSNISANEALNTTIINFGEAIL